MYGVLEQMKIESALGPHGLGVAFFKHFWNLVKIDMTEIFINFDEGALDIKRLNFGVITLVPKAKEATNIRQFRPTCLLNVQFKIFTKTLANNLVRIAKEVIGRNQTGFIKVINNLEGVITWHDVMHEHMMSKGRGLIMKNGFENAYDRVN